MLNASEDALVETLVAAFFDDPLYVWLFEAADRAAALRDNFAVVLGAARDRAHVDVSADGCAVAVWTEPGVALIDDPTALVDVLHRWAPRQRLDCAVAGMAACAAQQPADVHVLHLVGVRPDLAGRGVGSRLLEARLTTIDRAGTPAYLESSSRRNHTVYRRLGFRHLPGVPVDDGVSVWPMLRDVGPPVIDRG